MRLVSEFNLNFEEETPLYYKLLKEEDFDFKNKNIITKIRFREKIINVQFLCKSIIDLKIAHSALIRSLEIIEKTLNV